MPSEYDDASFNEYVRSEIAKRDAQIDELQAKNEDLQRQIRELKKQKGIASVRDGLTFNPHTGLWSDKASGLSYCGACLDKDKRNPLKSELPWGWRCSAVQDHYFPNPDAPDPNANLDDPRDSWLDR